MMQQLYRLCDQTVTVYHAIYHPDGSFECEQRLLEGVYFDVTDNRDTMTSGSRLERGFLLVIPNASPRPLWMQPISFDRLPAEQREGFYTLCPGDKILPGAGPQVQTRAQWAALVPQAYDGLAGIRCVDAKQFRNAVCHVECEGMRSYAPRTNSN